MRRFYSIAGACLMLFMVCSISANAKVSLPAIFCDHMVLQQNADVVIWGFSKSSENVKVTPSWNNLEVATKADNNGYWKLTIKTPAAGGPYTINVQGQNLIVLNDVLIGEVWFCSGQSNMEWSVKSGINDGENEKQNANFPKIRLFNVSHRVANSDQLDVDGKWTVCTPETMQDFSSVAYFFGRELHQNLDVPIGLINSSWGGTPAEVWINPNIIKNDTELSASASKLPETSWASRSPGGLYFGMVEPIIPFRIAGAIWYQGESNTNDPKNYEKLFPAMIQNWRNEWGYEFPFYYVQIAPFKYGRHYQGAMLRDAQRKSLSIPNTGMVVISDIGNTEDIHPRNKQDVGKRLANWALNKTYGKNSLPVSGPLYKSMKKEKNKIRITFDYAENGLMAKGKELTHFEIAGEDRNFVPAKATIDGNAVVVQSKQVKNPIAVRFAFTNTAEPNLFNKEGLPASSFRTDDWEIEMSPINNQ